MKKSLIFDIDGTLWNACSASAKGWNKGLEKLGIQERVTGPEIESVSGYPYEKCIETLLPGKIREYSTLLDTLNIYEEKVIGEIGGIFYDNAIEGIKRLSENYQIFLISNCQDWYIEKFIEISKLKPFIRDYDCFGMSGVPKDQMIKNMNQKHSFETTIYIGDTPHDEKSTIKANSTFIHLSHGFGECSSSSLSFEDFDKLTKYLLDDIIY